MSAGRAVSLPPGVRAGPQVSVTPGRPRGERRRPLSRLPPGPSVAAADAPGRSVRSRLCEPRARRLRRKRRRRDPAELRRPLGAGAGTGTAALRPGGAVPLFGGLGPRALRPFTMSGKCKAGG